MTRPPASSSASATAELPRGPQHLLAAQLFGRVHADSDWEVALRHAAERGTIIHIMRSSSLIDLLCLDHICKRSQLPLIRFVNNTSVALTRALLGPQLFQPATTSEEEGALQSVVHDGNSALLFLRGSTTTSAASEGVAASDLLRALVQAQRSSERPILLVPQTLVWGKLPSHKRKTVSDLLFGSADDPGHLRVLSQLLLNPSDAVLRAGPPFDLRAFLLCHDDLIDDDAADKVRYALLRRIERERTVVLGPRTKTPDRIRDEILRSRRLRPHLESAARASDKSIDEVTRQASADLDALIAAPSATLLGFMNRGLDHVWNRLYDGLVVDEEGMARVREASRLGTLVLLPSHKSHIDYVVLSDVFYAHGLSTPIVAAGDNLNFWPLGPTLRRAGAFFIHRAIAGQKLYAALLSAYVRRLLLEGFTLEVFLEGGRSRTGKLLAPKFGLLSMIVDAALTMYGHPIYFVPISIVYERVIEERAFVDELAGFDKQAEDLAGLLQAPRVFRSRYGRLFLQVGEIFSFDDMLLEARRTGRPSPDGSLSPKARRTLIHDIANRTAREINRVTAVTPSALTATALLCDRRRGLTKAEVVESARDLMIALQQRGARMTAPLAATTVPQLADAISEALELFVDAKLVQRQRTGAETVYRVPSSQRIALEYYKNTILHFFSASALVASAFAATQGNPIASELLIANASSLHARVKFELPLRSDGAAAFAECIETMQRAGEIVIENGVASVPRGQVGSHVERYAWMIRGSLESHRIALRGAQGLQAEATKLGDWLKQTLAIGDRMYLAGEIEVREAVSRDRLENALHALHEVGLVRLQSDTSVSVGKAMSAERLRDEDAEIKRYLT